MWGQRGYRQSLREPMTPDRTVANGYMQWFYENEKPFILSEEERARVIQGPHLEKPRQQRGPRSIDASTGSRQRTRASSTSVGPVPASEGPSSFQPLIQFTVSFYYDTSDRRMFCRSISAIQFDDECAFTCSWTVLSFSTSISDISGTPSSVSTRSGLSGSGHRDDDEDGDDAETDEEEDDDDDDDDNAGV
ncbi:hypothetical protein V6N13_142026 [Hibiscus sabdariffa]